MANITPHQPAVIFNPPCWRSNYPLYIQRSSSIHPAGGHPHPSPWRWETADKSREMRDERRETGTRDGLVWWWVGGWLGCGVINIGIFFASPDNESFKNNSRHCVARRFLAFASMTPWRVNVNPDQHCPLLSTSKKARLCCTKCASVQVTGGVLIYL